MNKNDSDDLEIEENVMKFYTEVAAKDLSKNLADVIRDSLTLEKYTTEGTETAIQLLNQMYLDGEPLNMFAENIEQKLQQGVYSKDDVIIIIIIKICKIDKTWKEYFYHIPNPVNVPGLVTAAILAIILLQKWSTAFQSGSSK